MASTSIRSTTSALHVVITPTHPSTLLALSPSSRTLSVKQTETPRKLKKTTNQGRVSEPEQNDDDEDERNNNRDDNQDERTPVRREWSRRVCFSPRPKRQNPGRRPVQSMRSLRQAADDEETKTIKETESFRLSNQYALDRIQEGESADEEEDGEDDDDDADQEYDGDGEEDEAAVLALYKSLSGDVALVHKARPLYDHDDDMVRM